MSILGFTGNAGIDNGAVTNDRLLFANNPGFTAADLANWQFLNDAGTAYAVGEVVIPYKGYYEIVPIPEPATAAWVGVAAVGLGIGAWRRRRVA